MFEVSVEGLEALSKKFDELDEQIKALQTEVPDELTAWQREDMHRRYPNTEANTTGGLIEASTEIWPRSRLEVAGGPKRIRPHRLGDDAIAGQLIPAAYLPVAALFG